MNHSWTRCKFIGLVAIVTLPLGADSFLAHKRKAFQSGAASSLLTDLVAYWPLDEASGNRSDAHTGGHTLTDNNTVTSSSGLGGTVATFTRANSEDLTRADNAQLSIGANQSFTISCWFKVATHSAGQYQTVVSKSAGGTREFHFIHGATTGFVYAALNDGTGTYVFAERTITGFSTGTWYHALFWFDDTANTFNLKINDGTTASEGTGSLTSYDSAHPFNIGSLGGSHYFDGDIAHVGVWKRVLTSDERTALYGSGTPPAYPFTGLP
jgi:Concanavalin A-like lectin/glucanases superfamily